jgi:hypothetical protein
MNQNMPHPDATKDPPGDEQIHCPHCHFDFKKSDIAYTLNKGFFKCPICGKKIPASPLDDRPGDGPNSFQKLLVPVLMIIGVVVVLGVFYLLNTQDSSPPITVAETPTVKPPLAGPTPGQGIEPPSLPSVPEESVVLPESEKKNQKTAQTPLKPFPDKMKIVKAIAAMYHASHSYTLAGGFVCLDMAIDVWNQLRTYGIEAKIMGGIVTTNITAWNFQKLAFESNHAWVVATLSPTEKVAIETTEGKVILPDMENASAYFKGIAFDTPAEIKMFEFYRRKTLESCRETGMMIKDWDENVAGKRHKYEDIVARKTQIESRKLDCENNFNKLREFESRAIYY